MTVQDLHQPPLPEWAERLTWAGVLPFVGALAAWIYGGVSSDAWLMAVALKAFLLYSAVILSFLGGIRWGRAMGCGGPGPVYVLAVLPSLWAFPALFLPPLYALASLALGFALALWFDTRADTLPATPGFRRLRMAISTAVIASHGVALLLLGRFGAGSLAA